MLYVDFGVFAHNEAAGIAAMVARLAAQDVLATEGISARVLVLANGCKDATVARARAAAVPGIEVVELAKGGKSRTWNRFVHHLSRSEAQVLVFVDADIEFSDAGALRRLAQGLAARADLWVLNSQPVKDIVARPEGLSRIDRLIAAASGGLDDWQKSICGQLYAMPTEKARLFHLPIGLPVEDGFLRAMVLTDALTFGGDLGRIDGLEGAFHIYASERSIGALIRHQTRIVIGSAINAACFAGLRDLPAKARMAELGRAAGQEDWLPNLLRNRLPRLPFGYVPWHFLTKRLLRIGQGRLTAKRILVTLIGFGFDLVVFLRAQIAMARGAGAGHW